MNKFILLDLINLYQIKELISIIYYNKYSNLLEYEHFADKYWLVSDIVLYIKHYKYNTYKKVNNFYKKNIRYINYIHNQITYFLGILSPEERSHFIDQRLTKN